MVYSVVLQIEAIHSLQDAFEWYEEQKDGLGYELLEEIESCYQYLSLHPERYSYINHLYRRIKPKRFPYLLIYEIEDDTVIIINIRHIKQKLL